MVNNTSTQKDKGKKFQYTLRLDKIPAKKIICPKCGNDTYFYEVAHDVTITTYYVQNDDGSFTLRADDSKVVGDINLYCGECNEDLTRFHNRFVEMIF